MLSSLSHNAESFEEFSSSIHEILRDGKVKFEKTIVETRGIKAYHLTSNQKTIIRICQFKILAGAIIGPNKIIKNGVQIGISNTDENNQYVCKMSFGLIDKRIEEKLYRKVLHINPNARNILEDSRFR